MDFNFDDYIPIFDEESNHILAFLQVGQDIQKFAWDLAYRLGETTHYTVGGTTYFCKPNGGVYTYSKRSDEYVG